MRRTRAGSASSNASPKYAVMSRRLAYAPSSCSCQLAHYGVALLAFNVILVHITVLATSQDIAKSKDGSKQMQPNYKRTRLLHKTWVTTTMAFPIVCPSLHNMQIFMLLHML